MPSTQLRRVEYTAAKSLSQELPSNGMQDISLTPYNLLIRSQVCPIYTTYSPSNMYLITIIISQT